MGNDEIYVEENINEGSTRLVRELWPSYQDKSNKLIGIFKVNLQEQIDQFFREVTATLYNIIHTDFELFSKLTNMFR